MAIMIEPQPGLSAAIEPTRVLPPVAASLFAARAQRFEHLAEGHALGDWLRFLGRLSRAQHAALQEFPVVRLPAESALDRARDFSMPPLHAQSWARDPAWRGALLRLAQRLAEEAPEASRSSLRLITRLDEARLEALADQVLATEYYGPDAALLPFVAAALEVYWTAMAGRLGRDGIVPLDVPGICPACGFLPVASVVRTGDGIANLRYLHCSLCNTEWNLVRVKCSACDSTAKISYRHIESADIRNLPAVRAETCDECMSYLKIVFQEKAPEADPVADDLATLALDMLVDEAGYARAGPNLLFVPGNG
jgi:FdhE protein